MPTPARSAGRSWPSWAARSSSSGTPSAAPTTHEDDALVAAKAAAAFKHGLTPIVCIGEQLEIREAGNHVEHNVEQLRGSLAGLSAEQIGTVVIAYEPVWAIGTGRVASAADAQEVCKAIRDELGKLASPEIAAGVRVLYGGSVNAKNVGEIVGPGGRRRRAGRAARRSTASSSPRCRRSRPVARCPE